MLDPKVPLLSWCLESENSCQSIGEVIGCKIQYSENQYSHLLEFGQISPWSEMSLPWIWSLSHCHWFHSLCLLYFIYMFTLNQSDYETNSNETMRVEFSLRTNTKRHLLWEVWILLVHLTDDLHAQVHDISASSNRRIWTSSLDSRNGTLWKRKQKGKKKKGFFHKRKTTVWFVVWPPTTNDKLKKKIKMQQHSGQITNQYTFLPLKISRLYMSLYFFNFPAQVYATPG